ncbi:MAG: class I SAM-dependent methyltransferase [Candidatus Woesearchaeota archaeon]
MNMENGKTSFREQLHSEFELFKKIKDHFEKNDADNIARSFFPIAETKHGIWAPSNLLVLYEAFSKLGIDRFGHFLDIGSGDGRVVFLASLFTKASGVDSDEHFHRKALEHSKKLGVKVVLLNRDFIEHNFSPYDVLFINPDKPFAAELVVKLLKEAKGKTIIVYNSLYLPPSSFKKVKTIYFESLPVSEFVID